MRRAALVWMAALMVSAGWAAAERRVPGLYRGVVLYDRWDGCYLYDAIYVTYIPEKLKDGLREYAGKCVALDAAEVYQPINPGDGRLEKFRSAGFSQPEKQRDFVGQISLVASLMTEGEKPYVRLVVTNRGPEKVDIRASELAITLLAAKPKGTDLMWGHPSDGPSFALITRMGLTGGGDENPRWQNEGMGGGQKASWKVREPGEQSPRFSLAAGATKEYLIDFTVPAGEYDFVFGYGSGGHALETVASNLVAVDVAADGKVTAGKVEGR